MATYVTNLLTATAASTAGSPTPTTSWQWLRNSTAIESATASSYTVLDIDVGQLITVKQTETNFMGTAPATSASDGPVLPFNPIALFASSNPGVWYDPSDLTTMFQDTAGTTPVTTPGQTVALALDKSKGLTLGPELLINGDFTSGTANWTPLNSTIAVASGVLTVTATGLSYGQARQTINTITGKTYKITATVSLGTATLGWVLQAGNIVISLSGTTLTQRTGFFVASGATTEIIIQTDNTVSNGTVLCDDISVKELAGNHATQATTASRPTYGTHPIVGIRNVAQGSADVGNITYWPATVLSNGVTSTKIASGIDTDGLPYVDVRYQGTSTSTFHSSVYATAQSRSPAAVGQTFTASAYIKRIAGSIANLGPLTMILVEETAPTTFVNQTASPGSLEATEILDTVSRTLTSGNQVRVAFVLNFDSGVTYDVTFRVKGLQLEQSSSRTAYQFNYNRFNVTQPPLAQVNYLFFDGVDDFLVTPTITPGVDKAQVFAGVRKLSDAARGTVAEIGAGGSNGSFAMEAPDGNGLASFAFRSIGTSTAGASFGANAAPITKVVTGLVDIAAPSSILRLNGSQVSQNTSTQGTGNYLAYPLYIGRRGGTVLPFNGQIYGLIVRFGSNLTTTQITTTETWVNGKTGAY
jgi:hypothetical protein